MKTLSLKKIDALLKIAFQEDIGKMDKTTKAIITRDYQSTGHFVAKENMIIAGLDIAKRGFFLLDKKASFKAFYKDGDFVKKGKNVARVKAKVSSLLKGERAILNILQRLSGIATLTRRYKEEINDLPCEILDTRKTTPGLRAFEKYAVRVGGGRNHRFALFDRILIKENHIAAAGGVNLALEKAMKFQRGAEGIEVEVRNLKELKEALRMGAKQILLDHFNLKAMKKAVALASEKAKLEASGDISLHNLRNVAKTGVDCVSIGLLTHSPKSMDISFIVHPKKCLKK